MKKQIKSFTLSPLLIKALEKKAVEEKRSVSQLVDIMLSKLLIA